MPTARFRHPFFPAAGLLAVCVGMCLVAAPAAAGEGMPAVDAGAPITQVLERSQALRLAALTPVATGDARLQLLQQGFQQVLAHAPEARGLPVTLQVVTGPVLAETFHGRVLVVHADLAARPEGERLFVLAHELGHAVHADWAAVRAVYRRHIPAEVVQQRTDPVAALLGREMSALSHEQELNADAYAMQVLGRMGYGIEVAIATLARHGVQPDTPTHPGTRRRLAGLRNAAP
ncbi:MAG: M48 family metalloprotease [Aquincola tertiaricarbonis]